MAIVQLAEDGANAALDGIARRMDAGFLEILTANGTPIARLRLSGVAAPPAEGSELALNPIAEAEAQLSATAKYGRIIGATGTEVLSCDVSDLSGDAVIKLNTTEIKAGAPLRIASFKLSMP
jgi:hypothetical protein